MKSINQQVLNNAITQRERTLKISAYTITSIGMAGMLFFMFCFLFNSVGRQVEGYLIGFIFTSLIFAFGVSSLNNLNTKKK